LRGELGDACFDRFQAPGQCVVDGDAEADLGCVVGLPVLEATGVVAELVLVGCGSWGVQVEEGGREQVDDAAAHVQEAHAAGADSMLQPIRSTLTSVCPTDWQASSR
jgi:hypothetical protein